MTTISDLNSMTLADKGYIHQVFEIVNLMKKNIARALGSMLKFLQNGTYLLAYSYVSKRTSNVSIDTSIMKHSMHLCPPDNI